MRWTLDLESGSLYIYVREGRAARQAEVAGAVVDLDDDGEAVGIEVLSAWEPIDWHAVSDGARLNEAQATTLEFIGLNLLHRIMGPNRRPAPDPATSSAEPARVLVSV